MPDDITQCPGCGCDMEEHDFGGCEVTVNGHYRDDCTLTPEEIDAILAQRAHDETESAVAPENRYDHRA